jgi:iron complex transport system ATP-binding protein
MTITQPKTSRNAIQNPILDVQGISGGYSAYPLVQQLYLTLEQGNWLSLVGPNGSGKSTILKLLTRILSPLSGCVYLNGRSMHESPAKAIAQILAFLPQQQTVPQGLTVRQLVGLGRSPHQDWWEWNLSKKDLEVVDRSIAQVRLEKFSDRPVEDLSGGERQRAFLALALAQEPRVLLLDEPTTYLDVHYQLELLELLKHLNEAQDLTIVTVLHELNLAARYSDRIAVLNSGSLHSIGQPNAVMTPEMLAEVFKINAEIIHTSVGLQICPISPI